MTKVKDIIQTIEAFAPPELAEKWDNIGLLVGDSEQEIKRVFLCLDVTSEVAAEAVEFGADLIIAHHPMIYPNLTRVTEQEVAGRIVRALTKNDISAFAAHTNFDSADGGLCDILAEKLGLQSTRKFTDNECRDEWGNPTENFGRIGKIAPTTLAEFAKFVEQKLNVVALKYVGEPNCEIKTVAVCSGGGADMLYAAHRAGADVFVVGDVKHHIAQLATEIGLAMIDAGHFETEILFCDFMKEFLGEKFPALEVGISKAESFFKSV